MFRVRKLIPHFSKQRNLAVFVVIDQPECEASFRPRRESAQRGIVGIEQFGGSGAFAEEGS
jgi:hypothetical protein